MAGGGHWMQHCDLLSGFDTGDSYVAAPVFLHTSWTGYLMNQDLCGMQVGVQCTQKNMRHTVSINCVRSLGKSYVHPPRRVGLKVIVLSLIIFRDGAES